MAAALDEPGWGHAAGVPPALVLALIASLALHAAVLRVLSIGHHAEPELPQPAALRVRIVTPARAAPAPPRTAAHRPMPLRVAKRVAPPARARAEAPPAVGAPRARATPAHRAARRASAHHVARRAPQPRALSAHPRPATPLPAAVASAAPPARAAPAPPRAPPALPEAHAVPSGMRPVRSAPPPGTSGKAQRAAAAPDDHLALAQYRGALMAQAQRYARYPRLARDNDWQGTVELRMVVGRDGALAALGVRRGTGYAVLDREALHMLRRAEPLAPIPHALRGRRFSVDIPVIFRLREPG